MRYVSLFSGIEAASVAWEGLGWEPVAFSEIDPFPCAVLAERFPEVPNLGDITGIKWKRYRGKADLVVGGSPCQSFSIAGKREGLDGASGLMWEYVRCVREVRPRWLLWENVPGALSSSGGEDFRCLLEALEKLGYGLAWRVLDSQFFGVPQRRRRVFLVGHSGGVPRPEVLFERESLRWDFASSKDKRKELVARSGRSAKAAGFCNAAIKAESIGFVPAQHQRGELRMDGVDGQTVGAVLATRSGKQLQAVVESQNDRTVGALCARDFKGVGNEYVSEGKLVVDRSSCMIRVYCVGDATSKAAVDEDVAGTLKVGGSPGYISAKTAVVRCGAPGGGKGALVSDDVSLTLATGNEQTLFAPKGRKYVVRRLTPTECERLQGFPDGWTKVPYRGKPAEECPDGPRYKALGNSMAVPVMRWIGKRIALAESGSCNGPCNGVSDANPKTTNHQA